MNLRDLTQILGKLPEDVQIITIDSPEKIVFVPKAIIADCERVRTQEWVVCIFRKAAKIAGAWPVAATLFPSIVPTPERLIKLAVEEAPQILASIDWSFSQGSQIFSLLFPDMSLDRKKNLGTDYFVPATGVTASTVDVMRNLRRL
jgi:hypothetical protein